MNSNQKKRLSSGQKMKLTIKLTIDQARMLLKNLPQGHEITLSVKDADRIIGKNKLK